ncbi:hypothetical protein DFJ77DRAFT_509615 [Powellomyces hirtus]|nr:hypothetical protein DFJ77DRAFT_509615 [Powellomyces hirtus]
MPDVAKTTSGLGPSYLSLTCLKSLCPSTPVHIDSVEQSRIQSQQRLKLAWESIFERYGKEFDDADEIDITTGEIVVDNGWTRKWALPDFGNALYPESDQPSTDGDTESDWLDTKRSTNLIRKDKWKREEAVGSSSVNIWKTRDFPFRKPLVPSARRPWTIVLPSSSTKQEGKALGWPSSNGAYETSSKLSRECLGYPQAERLEGRERRTSDVSPTAVDVAIPTNDLLGKQTRLKALNLSDVKIEVILDDSPSSVAGRSASAKPRNFRSFKREILNEPIDVDSEHCDVYPKIEIVTPCKLESANCEKEERAHHEPSPLVIVTDGDAPAKTEPDSDYKQFRANWAAKTRHVPKVTAIAKSDPDGNYKQFRDKWAAIQSHKAETTSAAKPACQTREIATASQPVCRISAKRNSTIQSLSATRPRRCDAKSKRSNSITIEITTGGMSSTKKGLVNNPSPELELSTSEAEREKPPRNDYTFSQESTSSQMEREHYPAPISTSSNHKEPLISPVKKQQERKLEDAAAETHISPASRDVDDTREASQSLAEEPQTANHVSELEMVQRFLDSNGVPPPACIMNTKGHSVNVKKRQRLVSDASDDVKRRRSVHTNIPFAGIFTLSLDKLWNEAQSADDDAFENILPAVREAPRKLYHTTSVDIVHE